MFQITDWKIEFLQKRKLLRSISYIPTIRTIMHWSSTMKQLFTLAPTTLAMFTRYQLSLAPSSSWLQPHVNQLEDRPTDQATIPDRSIKMITSVCWHISSKTSMYPSTITKNTLTLQMNHNSFNHSEKEEEADLRFIQDTGQTVEPDAVPSHIRRSKENTIRVIWTDTTHYLTIISLNYARLWTA